MIIVGGQCERAVHVRRETISVRASAVPVSTIRPAAGGTPSWVGTPRRHTAAGPCDFAANPVLDANRSPAGRPDVPAPAVASDDANVPPKRDASPDLTPHAFTDTGLTSARNLPVPHKDTSALKAGLRAGRWTRASANLPTASTTGSHFGSPTRSPSRASLVISWSTRRHAVGEAATRPTHSSRSCSFGVPTSRTNSIASTPAVAARRSS